VDAAKLTTAYPSKLTVISVVVALKTIAPRLRTSGQDHAQGEADQSRCKESASWALSNNSEP
jgi:hypothetical protein